jgi:transmembrane protein 33
LIPILLFAILHVSSYTRALLQVVAPNSLKIISNAANYVINKDKDIMRFAAINEILLMPAIILSIFR